MESESQQTSDEIKNDESFGIAPIDSIDHTYHKSQKNGTSNSRQTNSAIQDESAREVLKNISNLNEESNITNDLHNSKKKSNNVKNKSQTQIKHFESSSASNNCFDSSNLNHFYKYQNQINKIHSFIENELNRLHQVDANLKMHINQNLADKISLISVSPTCSIRCKLYQMGLLPK